MKFHMSGIAILIIYSGQDNLNSSNMLPGLALYAPGKQNGANPTSKPADPGLKYLSILSKKL